VFGESFVVFGFGHGTSADAMLQDVVSTEQLRSGFTLEGERETAKTRKEKLCAQAEEPASSTDWGTTASAYRDLMRSWKEAGRAGRADEEALWGRFKAAQDQFFSARSAVQQAKDAELREHAKKVLDSAKTVIDKVASDGPRSAATDRKVQDEVVRAAKELKQGASKLAAHQPSSKKRRVAKAAAATAVAVGAVIAPMRRWASRA